MFNIVYTPSGTVVSQYATIEDAQLALAIVETNPPSHELVEVPDVAEEVTDGNN